MSDIFVSYKREDRPRVETIVAALDALGLSVWFDTGLTPGEEWRNAIDREIEHCGAMLVCWSPSACNSKEVLRESAEGLRRKVLVPVRLEQCTIPDVYQPVHSADLSAWDATLDAPEWLSFLSGVEEVLRRKDIQQKSRERAAGQATSSILRSLLIEQVSQGETLDYADLVSRLQRKLISVCRSRAECHLPLSLWCTGCSCGRKSAEAGAASMCVGG